MVKINYGRNWNNLLIYGSFHAIIPDQAEYNAGVICDIFLQGNYMGKAEVLSCKRLYFRQLDDTVAMSFGKDLAFLRAYLLREYNYIKWNNQKLLVMELTWIAQTPYWAKIKQQTLNLKRKRTLKS